MRRSRPPLRLLLYVEWLLLGLCFLTLVLRSQIINPPQSSWLSLLLIVVFGLMGLRLPSDKLSHKLLYTAVEFGFILLPSFPNEPFRPEPFLALIIVIRGCQMFDLPGRLIITGLAFTTLLYGIFSRETLMKIPAKPFASPPLHPNFEPLSGSHVLFLKLNIALSTGLALMFVLLLVNAVVSERRSRQELAIAHEQLRQYSLRIENQATLQERNRIAREIHDSLGHTLTAQRIQLENALLFLSSHTDKTQAYLTDAKQLGYQALQEVSRSVATLRADPLQGQSFAIAIQQLIQDFRCTTTLVPDYSLDLTVPVPYEVGIALYRIVQEALTNISKYSAATQVMIQISADQEQFHLQIEDNGIGFHPEQNTTGFGLQTMRERTLALGGTLHIDSRPEKGCRIQATIPAPSRPLSNSDALSLQPLSHYSLP